MNPYGKLCTQFYDIDKPSAPPDALEFYSNYARRAQGPILEPMCGSGRFLLPLLAEGLDVEGIDVSPEMLDACRANARPLGLSPILHQQSLEKLALDRQFGLVFIPSGSFCLLIDEASIDASLRRIHDAMLPGATFVVEVERAMAREPSQSGDWGGRWVVRPDGAKLIISWLNQYSGVEKVSRSVHRYELVKDGKLVDLEYEDFELRFYEPLEFRRMLEAAGFTRVQEFGPYREAPPTAADEAIVFACIKA